MSFCVERSIIIDRAQRFNKSEIRNLKSQIINSDIIGVKWDDFVKADFAYIHHPT
ncbi:hypothetical protein D1AOALGA4SA_10111 [Olavius algarvensis Delta 1 endosymbiont]|nr:hypothetical protein D1AOALGA4SA_10111 [Olavius algarvensis Delta 1 endosymbiont]